MAHFTRSTICVKSFMVLCKSSQVLGSGAIIIYAVQIKQHVFYCMHVTKCKKKFRFSVLVGTAIKSAEASG